MEKRVVADGYIFDFSDDALDAYVFDSAEHNGIRNIMGSVDIIAEFPEEYLYIELKKYRPEYGGMKFRCPLWDDKLLIKSCPLAADDNKRVEATIKRIARDLRQKYCDTFLYNYAEDKLNKPVNYICVVEGCDVAQALRLNEIMALRLPKGVPPQTKWVRPIVKNMVVVNVNGWNASDKLKCYGRCSLAV